MNRPAIYAATECPCQRHTRANWAGLAIYHHVLDLHRKGRKSAWVHDLMQIRDTEMSKR